MDGATGVEQLLAACKQDYPELVVQVLKDGSTQVNGVDGVGNTGLHYAAQCGSVDCIEALAQREDLDPNIKNRIEGNTPLHLAVTYQDEEVALEMAGLLIERGADPRISNRMGQTAIKKVPMSFKEMRTLLLQATLARNVSSNSIDTEESE